MLRPFPFSLLPTQANTSIISNTKSMNTNTATAMYSPFISSDTTIGHDGARSIVGLRRGARQWLVSLALIMVMMLSAGMSWGQVTNTITSQNFTTLQGAIDDVLTLNGHVITVAAGTYSEQVIVNKSVDIRGAQYNTSVLARTSGGLSESVVAAPAGQTCFKISVPNVSINGFTLNGSGGGRGVEETTPVAGTNVTANFISGFGGGLAVSISAGSTAFVISDNDIRSNYAGVYLSSTANSGTISNNIITAHVNGALDQGSAVVFEGGQNNISVINNNLSGNANALYAWTFGAFSNNIIENNNLSASSEFAVQNTSANNLALGCNWFGSANRVLINAKISGPASYTTFLHTGTDTDAAVGFQPDNSCSANARWYVNDGSNSGSVFTSAAGNNSNPGTAALPLLNIQVAINLATDGDTIFVDAGNYLEVLNLTKKLQLYGSNYQNPPSGSRVMEAILYPVVADNNPNTGSTLVSQTGDISGTTIAGFTFNGDNLFLGGIDINGANVDAIGAIGLYDGSGDLTIENNIVKNFSYSGIEIAAYPLSLPPSQNNKITNNLIQNVEVSPYGTGILTHYNAYAEITNNVMTDVRVGFQTGNFTKPNGGTPASFSNNNVTSSRKGIFHNVIYNGSSPHTISGNTFTAKAGSTNSWGMSFGHMDGTASAVVQNNTITGHQVGIDFWDNRTANTITVQGGTVSNCRVGVKASNYDGYSSNAQNASSAISGVTIQSCDTAVWIKDSPLNTNGATIKLTITDDCNIINTGRTKTGVLVSGSDATAIVDDNLASIHGFAVGIDVVGGSTVITSNHIYDNGIGVRFSAGGAGDVNTNDFSGTPNNGVDIQALTTAGLVSATPNNIFAGTTFGIDNQSTTNIDASNAYWSSTDGPGGAGIGTGAAITAKVTYCPYLSTKPVPFGGTGVTGASQIHNITASTYHCTIQEAIDAASANDVIELSGTIDQTSLVDVNKPLTIQGMGINSTTVELSSTWFNAGASAFTLSSPNITIKDIYFKIVGKGSGNILGIFQSNTVIQNNKFSGEYVFGDVEVTRAGVWSSNNMTGLVFDNNIIESLRQPGYINNGTGTISNNTITNTRGWVIAGAGTLSMTGNKFNSNTSHISIIPGSNITGLTISNNDLSGTVTDWAIDNQDGNSIANASCNWFGSTNYTTVESKTKGKVIFVPFSASAGGACSELNAVPASLMLTYTKASENVQAQFNVAQNDMQLRMIPGLNPAVPADLIAIGVLYNNLKVAVAGGVTSQIQAAALAVGDDIIMEYYYMSGGTKVYVKTTGGADLIKNKYWDKYLVRTSNSERLPDWTNSKTLVIEDQYATSTNPLTGTVSAGWLNDVLGKDLHVDVTFVHNGTVTTVQKTVAIDAGLVNVYSAFPIGAPTFVSSHNTIQAAIDAATTLTGYIVDADSGVFTENVAVNKSITLIGSQFGIDARSRGGLESVINGKITITADNVAIDGFTLSPASGVAVEVNSGLIFNTGINIKNNIFTTSNGAISANSSNTLISKNKFNIVSQSGITFSNNPWNNITISDNEFSGSSWYDINFIGAKSYDTPVPISTNISVNDNTSSSTGNFLVSAFVENLSIVGNTISSAKTSTQIAIMGGNKNVDITNNILHGVGNGVSIYQYVDSGHPAWPSWPPNTDVVIKYNSYIAAGLAVNLASGAVSDGPVDATCNWYGSDDAFDAQASVSAGVTFLPYSTVDNPRNCLGLGPVNVYNATPAPATFLSSHMTIQAAINAATTVDGYFITAAAGTYDEQVLVNKKVSITGAGIGSSILGFTGTTTGKPTLFDVSKSDVTIEGFTMNVNQAKLASAIIAVGANLDNLSIKNNEITATNASAAYAYGVRNAISVNYGSYRINASPIHNMLISGNTIKESGTAYFRAGLAADEAGGLVTGNTITSINQDVQFRFGLNGPISITANTFKGGGVNVSSSNAGGGAIAVDNNIFTGPALDPSVPIVRMQGNPNNFATSVSGNTFTGYALGLGIENYSNITVDNNTFTPAPGATNFIHVEVNTKIAASSSSTSPNILMGGTFTNNTFNGSGVPGGIGLGFYNHKNDPSVALGSFVIGTVGNENTFEASLATFVKLDNQIGSSATATEPQNYTAIGTGPATTMACWSMDEDIQNNKFDVGTGAKTPATMVAVEKATLLTKLFDKMDAPCAGNLIPFYNVHNITQHTNFITIQAAIDAASTMNGDVITVDEGTYAEHVIINKSLDIRGPNYGISGIGVRFPEAVIVPEANFMPASNEIEVVKINANNVSFDGFKVSGDNPAISGYAYAGMNLEKGRGVYSEGNNVTFSNNIVEKATRQGFNAGGGVPTPIYTDITVSNNKFDNIQDLNQLGQGFAMYIQATTGAITNNTVVNSRAGIQVQPYRAIQNVIAPILSGNTFNVWRSGIYYNYAENSATAWTISGNTINAIAPPSAPVGPVRWQGITAESIRASSNGGVISGNTINGNNISDPSTWWAVNGMQYTGDASTSTALNFTGNTVTGVKTGFVHDAAADIVFTGNSLTYSEKAISVQHSFSSAAVDLMTGGVNNIDATGGNTYNGVASGGASLSQLFTIEDAINHKIDESYRGLVTVKTNELFVTINSFIAPGTTTPLIQRGINAASNGFVLNIGPGTFAENIIVNKSLEISGAGQGLTTIIPSFVGATPPSCPGSDCAGASNVIKLAANNIHLHDFSIDGNNPGLTSGVNVGGQDIDARNGIIGDVVSGRSNIEINDITVTNIYFRGIYPQFTTNMNVHNNTVSNVRGVNPGSIAIFSWASSGSVIDNTVSDAYDAIAANHSLGINFSNNNVSNSDSGIHSDNNGDGSPSTADIISGNTISNGSGTNSYGIMVFVPYLNTVVSNNIITNVHVGLTTTGALGVTPTVTMTRNTVNGMSLAGSTGAYITTSTFGFGDGVNNTIFTNNFITGTDQLMQLDANTGFANNLVANNNSFTGNASGIVKAGTGTTNEDLMCNWWGSSTASSVMAAAGAGTNYTPWLTDGTDDQMGTPGFQPTGTCLAPCDLAVTSTNTEIICGSTTGDIDITVTGGSGVHAYSWTGIGVNPSSEDQTGLAAGTYNVTVTDQNGCTATASVTILYLPVTNTAGPTYYATIQAAINAASNGDLINVCSGTYNEQVLVNKSVTITGVGMTQPIVDFTGTPTGKPTLFDVSANGVTIDNIHFQVNLATLRSAIIATSPGLDLITVKNNVIDPYGTPAGSYGERNAVSVNYAAYRVATGGVDQINFINNTVTGAFPAIFRSAISMDESAGSFTGNNLTGLNQDIQVRFASTGNITITGNTFNQGGVEIADANAGAGSINISNNMFAVANGSTYNNALRLKNNFSVRTTTVAGNTFTGHEWGISMENYQNVTIDNNTFTPIAASTTYRHITVNTKDYSSASGFYPPVVGATITNNTFNGSGAAGGIGLAFYNEDNDAPVFNAFTLGSAGNENNFDATIGTYIYLDGQTGPTAAPVTTMAPWAVNLDAQNNSFAGASPASMTLAQLFAVEDKIVHKIDNSVLGFVLVKANNDYVTVNSFVAPNTTPLIQRGIDAASNGFIVNVEAGTYTENIIVNKELTIKGPNASIDACSGSRVPEAIIVPATNAIASGEIFHIAASNVTISGFTIDGDNTLVNSGFLGTNGADINAAEGVAIYDDNRNNLTVENNIFQNLSFFGVSLNGNSGIPTTSGHVITHNKFQDLGTYNSGSGIALWGGGVLLYNNQYAAVTNNCMANVRIGIQTENFFRANTGTTASQMFTGNTISARKLGIFHNLAYNLASPITINNNTITGLPHVGETTNWTGMLLASLANSVHTASNNNINGSAITLPKTGISVWNDQAAPAISGGTITGVEIGINVNNFEGYPTAGSNASNTTATITGTTITGATIAGIKVHDNPSNSNGATVNATVGNTNTITGSPVGVWIVGSDATATVMGNNFTGNQVDIQVAANAGIVVASPNNNLSGATFGIQNLSSTIVNGTNNYWNDTDDSGPGAVGSGTGVKVSTLVDFCPWLNNFAPTGTPISAPVGTITVAETGGPTDNDGSICASEAVTLAVVGAKTGSTYLWSNGETTDDIMVNPATTTIYSVTVSYGGCSTVLNNTITVYPVLSVQLVSLQDVLCNGGSTGAIQVSGAGGSPAYSYMWSNGLTTSAISGLPIGMYSVMVTDANQCTASATYNILQPTVLSVINFAITNETCQPCNDGTITVNATGGTPAYMYSKDGGLTFQVGNVFTMLMAGNYQMVVKDANGCTTAPQQVTITENGVYPDLTPSTVISSAQFSPGNTSNQVVLVRNVGTGSTSAPIVFRTTNYTTLSAITVQENSGTSVNILGDTYILNNDQFDLVVSGGFLTFTSKPGVVIAPGGTLRVGLIVMRNNSPTQGGDGTVTSSLNIVSGTGGGELNPLNNNLSFYITKL